MPFSNLLTDYSPISIKQKIFYISITTVIFFIIILLLDYNETPNKENKTKYYSYGIHKNDTLLHKITNKIQLAVSTTATLGFGNIAPIHPISQFFLILQLIICLIIFMS